MNAWLFIGLSCIGFWLQGLFFGWETFLISIGLGLLMVKLVISKEQLRLPLRESLFFLFFVIGYGLHLIGNPGNGVFINTFQLFVVAWAIIIGLHLIHSNDLIQRWYQAFVWNGITLLVFGWMFKNGDLLDSVFGYANILAAICMMLMFLLYDQWLIAAPSKRRNYLLLLLIGIAVSLIATSARIAWGLTFIGLIVQTVFSLENPNKHDLLKKWTAIVAVAVTVVFAVSLMNFALWNELTQLSSLRIRFTYYWDAFRIVRENPWWGIGADGWGKLQYQYQTAFYTVQHVHNHLLQLWLDGGFLPVLAWIFFLCMLVKDFFIIRQINDRKKRGFTFSVWLGTVSVVTYSFLDFILSFPALMITVCMYFAVNRTLFPHDRALFYRLPQPVPIVVAVLVLAVGAAGLYREIQNNRANRALAEGEIHTVLQYEHFPAWTIPGTERNILLGKAYAEKAKRSNRNTDWERSLEYFKRGMESDPNDAHFYPEAAYAALQLKEYPLAVQYASRLISLQPGISQNYELYAYTLLKAGEYQQVLQIPEMLRQKQEEIEHKALFTQYIPDLRPSIKLQRMLEEARLKLAKSS